MYVVHYHTVNRDKIASLYMVRCPDGSGKLLTAQQLTNFLIGKCWRLA